MEKNYIQSALRAAVLSGDIKKLKMIHRICNSHGPIGNSCGFICELIASIGNLEMLQWVRISKTYMNNHVCAWDETTCAAAAINGHADVLKWAIENECPFEKTI